MGDDVGNAFNEMMPAPVTEWFHGNIRRDLPDMPMDEVVEFTLADETAAVRFVSHAPALGDVGETWFRRAGYLFQLSVVAPDRELQDAWLREIAANLTFADDALRP